MGELSRTIPQGQTVTVMYTDPSADDDTAALQDTAGNDVASFTATLTNNSTAVVAPPAPKDLTATAVSDTRIDLEWTAPGNGGSPITGHRIEVSFTGNSWSDLVADTAKTDVTYSHTGLRSGNRRYYRVSAINSVGTGTASNVADATTPDTIAPTLQTNSNCGDTFCVLVFNEPLDDRSDGAPPAGAFTVTADGDPVTVGEVSFGTSSYLLTNLSPTIKQGQTVTVTYADPTSGDDTAALQDHRRHRRDRGRRRRGDEILHRLRGHQQLDRRHHRADGDERGGEL